MWEDNKLTERRLGNSDTFLPKVVIKNTHSVASFGLAGEVPLEGASLPFMAAQTRGAGSRAQQVALASVDRISLGRAPHMKFKVMLGPMVAPVDRT